MHDSPIKLCCVCLFVEAVPKRILELMNVPSLTRENVASHLQVFLLTQMQLDFCTIYVLFFILINYIYLSLGILWLRFILSYCVF